MELSDNRSRLIADLFHRAGARFITITVMTGVYSEFEMHYHFDLNNNIYSVALQTIQQSIGSIADVFPAAGWAEREAADLFGVRFDGQTDLRPLVLRSRPARPPMAGERSSYQENGRESEQ
jgi:NADH:ubiquinone oxidoreductase subunit C